jgi:hypothetical protein
MQHAAFDSLGLSGVSARVEVRKGMPRVVLALPTFATLWRAACGTTASPKDSGLVFGSVRDAVTNQTVADASVELSWIDLVGGGTSLAQVGQRKWKLSGTTDERGEFALCGAPLGSPLTLLASSDSSSAGTMEIPGSLARVQRHDVLVARRVIATAASELVSDTLSGAASPAVKVAEYAGAVMGVVTERSGTPLANAAVAVDSLPEVRSGDDGRFVVRNIAPGTHQLSVIAIGKQPYTTTINLVAGDTARLAIPLVSVQTLEAVKVKATVVSMRLRNYEERKRTTAGAFRDSTEIKNYPDFSSVLRTVPSTTIRGRGLKGLVFGANTHAQCSEAREQVDWRIDGNPVTADDVATMDLQRIAVTEIYSRFMKLPSELMSNKRLRCAVWIWTKAGLGK